MRECRDWQSGPREHGAGLGGLWLHTARTGDYSRDAQQTSQLFWALWLFVREGRLLPLWSRCHGGRHSTQDTKPLGAPSFFCSPLLSDHSTALSVMPSPPPPRLLTCAPSWGGGRDGGGLWGLLMELLSSLSRLHTQPSSLHLRTVFPPEYPAPSAHIPQKHSWPLKGTTATPALSLPSAAPTAQVVITKHQSHLFLMVLEAGSPRSRYRQIWFLARALLQRAPS